MSNLRDQGLNVFREMLPGVLPDDLPNDKVSFGSGFAPELMEIGVEGIFGRLWAREGLSRRDRSLLTLGILIALGAEAEMESHFRIARQNGLTEDELADLRAATRPAMPDSRPPTPRRRWRCRPCALIGKSEPPGGIEPPTFSLRVRCSTD